MKIKFWGVRGSIPVPGEKTIKYGGNTPCLQINTKDNIIILDAGTGIRELGNLLIKENTYKKINLLLTHNHWDHIQGIPFFQPLFIKDYYIDIYSNPYNGLNGELIMDALMNPDFFPVDKEVFQANIKYCSIVPEKSFLIGSTKIDTITINHSKGTIAYKITDEEKSVVFMTDNEIMYNEKEENIDKESLENLNNKIIQFCKGCDCLIHDSMYTLNDFKNRKGWGHSNNIASAYLSLFSKVKNLSLFHFNPDYTDELIDIMIKDTIEFIRSQNSPTNCFAAKENLVIEF
jgi:phosphoribosyl 1,2-cyclic phosphodiesterase